MALLADCRYALRGLRRSPGFAAVAILTLALGIGANTAIFGAVEAVLLRPLPYPHAEQLVGVWESNPHGSDRVQVPGPDFGDWERQTSGVFSAIAAYAAAPMNLAGAGIAPERVNVGGVGAHFFRALAVNPELGRWFTAGEHVSGHAGAVLLGDGIWRRAFGADASVLGRSVLIDGEPFTVVGIMPPGIRFPDNSQIWVPLEHWIAVPIENFGDRTAHNFRVVARLAPGVSAAQAQAAMSTLAARLRQQYGTHDGAAVVPLRTQLAGTMGPALWILLGAVGLLLLIACANVANLLLARAGARQREVALRAALGASRGRIVGQLLTESILLGLLGGAVGLALAAWGTAALGAWAATILPPYAHVRLDGAVLAFTLLVALVTGVIFGLAPAWLAARGDVQTALQQGGARIGGGRSRLRAALIVAEVALSVVLLVGAGLMLRSLGQLLAVPLGFAPQRVWQATASIGPANPTPAQAAGVASAFARIATRLETQPGVEVVGVASELPLESGQTTNGAFQIAGRPAVAEDQLPYAEYRVASPGYFRALKIPLIRGREFAASDTATTPFVVVANRALVHRYWPGQNPIGQRMRFLGFWPLPGPPPWMEVVGVVGDTHITLDHAPRPMAYVPMAQQPMGVTGGAYIFVRSGFSGDTIAQALRTAIAAEAPQSPAQIGPLSAMLAEAVAAPRFRSRLLGLFALLALVLAAVGLYGVLSYLANQRQKEVGIRLALGARPAQVLALFIGEGLRLVIVGLIIGGVAALFAGRLIAQFLFGVTPADPTTFALVAVVLLATAVLATYVPARRAAGVSPMEALRYE